MRKHLAIIAIITTVIIIFFSIYVYTYYKADKPRRLAYEKAKNQVLDDNLLTATNDFYFYRGTKTWFTITGTDKSGADAAVFISEGDNSTPIKYLLADGITETKAVSSVKSKYNVAKILHANLGLEAGEPLWEIAYFDENNNLHYVYLDFFTGELL